MTNEQYTWEPWGTGYDERVREAAHAWIGTPYQAGQRCRGAGVDCVQLIAGVMDSLASKVEPTFVPRLPQLASIHSTRTAYRSITALLRAYKPRVVRDFTLRPGDVLVARAVRNPGSLKRPGHAMIVGADPYSVIHAVKPRVAKSSVHGVEEIIRVYRPGWAL